MWLCSESGKEGGREQILDKGEQHWENQDGRKKAYDTDREGSHEAGQRAFVRVSGGA